MRIPEWRGALIAALSACLTFSALAAHASSESGTGETFNVELFRDAEVLKLAEAPYPNRLQGSGTEGWVEVNFVIDRHGKPTELAIVNSTGNELFEQAALQAVESSTFKPAMMGGQPTESALTVTISFGGGLPATGASHEFITVYGRLTKAIQAGDKAAATLALGDLDVWNFYEDVMKNLAVFQYDARWGTEAQQLADLKRAIGYKDAQEYLSKPNFVAALKAMLELQVKTLDLAGALRTYKRLEKVSKDAAKGWVTTIEQIEALRRSDAGFQMQVAMPTHSWYLEMFKSAFSIAVTSGKVSAIRLRCDRQYLFFPYEPDVQYKVDSRNKACTMQVTGDPGTTFVLTQS